MLFSFWNEITIIFIANTTLLHPHVINLFNKYLLKAFFMCQVLVLGADGIKLKKTEIKLREMKLIQFFSYNWKLKEQRSYPVSSNL